MCVSNCIVRNLKLQYNSDVTYINVDERSKERIQVLLNNEEDNVEELEQDDPAVAADRRRINLEIEQRRMALERFFQEAEREEEEEEIISGTLKIIHLDTDDDDDEEEEASGSVPFTKLKTDEDPDFMEV